MQESHRETKRKSKQKMNDRLDLNRIKQNEQWKRTKADMKEDITNAWE